MISKKAQGLSINAIILIILALAVLVFLIFGFMLGWEKIMPWISPPNNVKDIATQCSLACSLNAKYDWCSQGRTLIIDGEETPGTCNGFSDNPEYGIECGTITCESVGDEVPEGVCTGDHIGCVTLETEEDCISDDDSIECSWE